MPSDQGSGIYVPDEGPALWYVHSGSGAVTRVDARLPEAVAGPLPGGELRPTSRERAILRALLVHVLESLDRIDSPDD